MGSSVVSAQPSKSPNQIPATQQQYRLIKQGEGPFKLTMVDAPVQQPGEHEVLVKVHAVSLNRRDVMIAKGFYPVGPKTSLVPLSDGAGEVVGVGSQVSRFKSGDRVAAIFFQKWLAGRPDADVGASAMGGSIDGMLSQYVTLHEDGLVSIPAHLSYEEAATLHCAAVTAWNALVSRGRMQANDNVLLLGTGGVSIFGLQFAAAAGAKPIITSSSDAKLARAKSLGAVATVNYRTTPEWDKAVREATGGVGAHQALEVGGQGTLAKSIASMGGGGHVAIIGGLAGFGGDIPAVSLMGRSVSVTGIFVGSRADFEAMNTFISEHKLQPVVDKVFDFKDAQAAYDYMDSGSHFGKLVIRL
ncbi:MAG: NAD(P)-dependent alcohol dehydrogenase [Proteobacteria bacterium]|nr:NAD(P)-dependent alcohol dehydrogenase [Pseudomonadota bacterium]